MAEQSNIYAFQSSSPILLKTNADEQEIFTGMHMIMSLVKMPRYRMYWESKTRYDRVADLMGVKRFDKLRNYLHFNDNSNMKKIR